MLKHVILIAVAAAALFGCQGQRQTGPAEYQTFARDPRRDTEAAARLNGRATQLIRQDKPDEAEKALKEALTRDLFFGPAHNNLGIVYFNQKKYYHAAWEFQYAAKLMADRPQPRNNLGLVMETVGRLDEAARNYNEALSLAPDSAEVTANLARVMVRTQRTEPRTRELLTDVIMKDTRPEWVSWARKELGRLGQPLAPEVDPATPAEGPLSH